ncbi:tRNA pseudouridine synthase A [Spirochaetia bacterium]|nr:tRNA pseudouridine synthase A [Spirochaetia bacterium]
MRNILITAAYDGTDFSGWQRQAENRTVQGEIESALEKIHKKRVPLTGAGRTDAGVHAVSQAANFYTDIDSMDTGRFVPALNNLLPKDVRITSAREVEENFHARFSAVMRSYRYYIICGRQALPHENRYAHQIWRRPSVQTLNYYARLLHGEFDCSLFASPADSVFTRGSGSAHRYIRNAYFFIEGEKLVFEISANAFFWKMVRCVTGTLLRCEEKSVPLGEFKKLLKEGDHSAAGPTIPPNGLFLWQVEYGKQQFCH